MSIEAGPVQLGEAAPSFAMPAVNRDGMVSLADFRGKTPLLIGLFRGLHCPFCRRQIVLLGATRDKLRALGVETLAVINTRLERARADVTAGQSRAGPALGSGKALLTCGNPVGGRPGWRSVAAQLN